MNDFLSAAFLLVGLLTVAAFAHAILPYLPEAHRSADTREMVRLVSSLVVTFAALVLSLIIASVNTAFFNNGNDMNALAGSIRQTDVCLSAYGSGTEAPRRALHRYVSGVLLTTWPEEPLPQGADPPQSPNGPNFENLALGELLDAARLGILALQPGDDLHKRLAALCGDDMAQVMANRWKLIGEAHSTISPPFYHVLAVMLVVVFACFGLNAPRNILSWSAVGLAAFIIAAAVFVMLELDGPLNGLIKVSSESMRTTFAELGR